MEKYLYDDLFKIEEDHWWHIARRKTVLLFISKFLKSKNPKILDIGCGTGKTMSELAEIGKAWGIDKSASAIKYCRLRGIKNIKQSSAYKTGFKNDEFDVITLLDVLEHTDESKTLNEIKRLIADDGVVIISVPAYSWLWSKWDIVQHHHRRYSRGDIKELLKRNGFEIVKISYMFSFLIIPVIAVRVFKSLLIKEDYTSDFSLTSNLLNKIFSIICDIERVLINTMGIPFGTSIVCVAKKTS